MIDPSEIIKKYTPEEICAGAENYYASHSDPELHIQKPLRSFTEAADNFEKLGKLLRGMLLGRSMSILDFGAGTCWLSAYLQQLGCKVTSCDPSPTALEIGKELVAANPFIENDTARYQVFNGRTIDNPDNTFDRIVCYDVMHHIPNWEEILAEMGRVLKPGGIIGFKEPGYRHAQASSAQSEMRNYIVLENDIHLCEIIRVAERSGLAFMGWEAIIDRKFTESEYVIAKDRGPWTPSALKLEKHLFENLRSNLKGNSIFHLSKGSPTIDSRTGTKLEALIEPASDRIVSKTGEAPVLALKITNTGDAIWLHRAEDDVGRVTIGAHLYDESESIIALDWARAEIPSTIDSGETFDAILRGPPLEKGEYYLEIDLVSEHVCWFEFATSAINQSKRVRLTVD